MVKSFDVSAVDEVSINRLVHHHGLAKSLHDVAWSQFARLLSSTAAWAGRR
jgi:transposase